MKLIKTKTYETLRTDLKGKKANNRLFNLWQANIFTKNQDRMAYNKEELIALPAAEKIALAEALWSSVENELLPITNEEIEFAKERLQQHEANPNDGMSLDKFKKYFADKYGF